MKATINHEVNEKISSNHRRKKGFTEGYKLFNLQREQIIDCRIYWGTTNCYAVLWVSHKGVYLSGSGVAGGHGYHKQSAAVSGAIQKCGIELNEAISGRGERAIKDAFKAIGRAFGYRKLQLVKIHE